MGTPDKIVLEHAGALGDFLLAWPAFLAVARHFAGRPICRAVRPDHTHWLAFLAAPCPPDLRQALDARFVGPDWPRSLDRVLVVRPGLAKRPEMPASDGFWFLPGVAAGQEDSPRELYRQALAARGIAWPEDFRSVFRERFGGHAPDGKTVLLVPGAGHPDKAWPIDRFEALARVLEERGLRPVFVLGPAELERGIAPRAGEILTPQSLIELAEALRTAVFVVGPDCGPLHLAALHGVPGLALFGPTSPRQWGPAGLEIVTANLSCSPCAAVTSGNFALHCPRPLPCLDGISVDMVLSRLAKRHRIPGQP